MLRHTQWNIWYTSFDHTYVPVVAFTARYSVDGLVGIEAIEIKNPRFCLTTTHIRLKCTVILEQMRKSINTEPSTEDLIVVVYTEKSQLVLTGSYGVWGCFCLAYTFFTYNLMLRYYVSGTQCPAM